MSEQANRIERNGRTAILCESVDPTVEAALFDQHGCETLNETGRGSVWKFPLDDGWGVLRKYRRGGLMRYLMPDAYLMANRPRQEFELLTRLREMGLPVPEPLGALWWKRGPFVRGYLATRFIEGIDLLTFALHDRDDKADVFKSVGVAILNLHDHGVFHGDLQLRNILLVDGEAHFIDFDRSVVGDGPLHRRGRERNLLRLRRSFDRNGVPRELYDALLSGYGMSEQSIWLDALYTVRGAISDGTRRS